MCASPNDIIADSRGWRNERVRRLACLVPAPDLTIHLDGSGPPVIRGVPCCIHAETAYMCTRRDPGCSVLYCMPTIRPGLSAMDSRRKAEGGKLCIAIIPVITSALTACTGRGEQGSAAAGIYCDSMIILCLHSAAFTDARCECARGYI